jgi:hypothetical protein
VAALRNARGEFVSKGSYWTEYDTEMGFNRGNQTWIGGRYHAQGVELNMASLHTVLADPHLLSLVRRKTEDMLEDAQEIAVLDEALYGMIVYNNRPELGPVGVVFCDNYPSVIDDQMHQTLLKVLGMHNPGRMK